MKIAIVHSFYSSQQPSGENTVVQMQVETLRSAGHDVHLVGRHTDQESKQRGYALRSALTVATGAGSSPAEELSRFRPDVVHLHNTFPNFGTGWLREWGPKTVATLHNFRTICAAGTLFRDGRPCSDCLDRSVRPAVEHACYRASRIATAPVAWATRPHGALRQIGERCREVLVLNADARVIFERELDRYVHLVPNFAEVPPPAKTSTPTGWVFVGRLTSEKGASELIEAWPASERLDMFGDGGLRGQIEEAVRRRGLTRVHLRGMTDHEQVLEELTGYEGLIVPSMCAEGLPTAVLEALARSVPIIASSFVSIASVLGASGAGVSVQMPMNTHSLGQALESVRSKPGVRAAARQLHGTRFSPEAWLRTIEPIYARVAAGDDN